MASMIDPKKIRIDCGTQARLGMNEEIIAEYAQAMERGEVFPAILVFFDEENDEFILADGWHRYHAHMRAKPNDPILAEQRLGTIEDAQWASIAANKSHGLQRSNADKRNATKLALLHPKGCELSDRQIAKHVGVHHDTVGSIRREMEVTGGIRQSDLRTGQDGRAINTKNISGKPNRKSKPDLTCGDCANLKGDFCQVDHEVQVPWTPACDLFTPIPPKQEDEEEEEDKPGQYKTAKPTKERNKHPTRRNKPRNTVCVDVPLDNPQLAAAELRAMLGEEYLRQCFISVRMLLANTHEDDPFPSLDH